MSVSVLVVEDNLVMQEQLVEFLGDEGYEPFGAASCQEALSLAEEHQFKVLVTDVRLPGLDGIDGLGLLKKKQPGLRCLVITGYAGEDGVEKAFASEVDDYLTKPFSVDAFLKAVDRLAYPNKLAKYYAGLFQSSPVKGMFAVAESFFQRNRMAQVDKAREKAFWGLLMAIRAGEMNADSANGVFYRLVKSDEEYQQFYTEQTKELGQELLERYRSIYQELASLVNTRMVKIGGERLPASEFRGLYEVVRQGLVTLEEFQMGPALYQITAEELFTAPALATLREKLWGSLG